ncbi:palmitoyl-protein thioesterase 1-like [Zingiber officinale]|uniref:palmitoyl-protein thioesterase 1-like n=1 Tax=Zingiber officinale TaxID=94328 RepID=UPI001C4B789B|nr:palmitoyl-protein thioesterase 1-like [Zingiber officinale]
MNPRFLQKRGAVMASALLKAIFVVLLLAISAPSSSSIPFVVFHGIADQCDSKEVSQFPQLLSNWSGSKGYCIEIGDGFWDSWFMPLYKQAEIACEKVKELKELSNGYNIVGLSQGNLIGRAVLEFCDDGPPVNNFVSLAGPHAGEASVPLCGSGTICLILGNLIKSPIYSDYVQDHLAPSGYIKIPTDIPKYMEKCKFLPKLNNENSTERNSTYKTRFTSLQNLVLIKFENDTVLVPRETSWFGYYSVGTFNTILPPQQTALYKEDWIGLKTLDDAGRVKYISVMGNHLKISHDDMKKHIVPYLVEKLEEPIRQALL